MILHVFAVLDRQAESFYNPMFVRAPGEAVRGFSDEINRSAENNLLYAHPDDFDLYKFGTFDTNTGEFLLLPRPENVGLGKNFKVNGSSA